MRKFFEELNPKNGMSDKQLDDYLFNKSLEIEPRAAKQPAKLPRKRDYSWKSPGIKPGTRQGTLVRRDAPMTFAGFSLISDSYVGIGGDDSSPSTLTPSTPTSPPLPAVEEDMLITTANETNVSPTQIPVSNDPLIPPPVPARPRRHPNPSTSSSSSLSDRRSPVSEVHSCMEGNSPPPLPPRSRSGTGVPARTPAPNDHVDAPPLPPRRQRP